VPVFNWIRIFSPEKVDVTFPVYCVHSLRGSQNINKLGLYIIIYMYDIIGNVIRQRYVGHQKMVPKLFDYSWPLRCYDKLTFFFYFDIFHTKFEARTLVINRSRVKNVRVFVINILKNGLVRKTDLDRSFRRVYWSY